MQKSPFSRSERLALERIKRKVESQKQEQDTRRQVTHVHESLLFNMELGLALLRFFLAPDWDTACVVLRQHPILFTQQAVEVLSYLVNESQTQQATEDSTIVQSHLSVLRYARDNGINALVSELRQGSARRL